MTLKRRIQALKQQAYPEREKHCLAWKAPDGTYTFEGASNLTEHDLTRMTDQAGCTKLIVIQWQLMTCENVHKWSGPTQTVLNLRRTKQ